MPMAEQCWVADELVVEMTAQAEEHFPNETGGVLIGYEAENSDIVVTAISGPGPRAQHRRFRFSPDPDYQQTFIEDRFRRTNGGETYLGDWHTHPGGGCQLSFLDRRTLARIAQTPSSGTARPIMAILAGDPQSWRLFVARFHRSKRSILCEDCEVTSLAIVSYSESRIK